MRGKDNFWNAKNHFYHWVEGNKSRVVGTINALGRFRATFWKDQEEKLMAQKLDLEGRFLKFLKKFCNFKPSSQHKKDNISHNFNSETLLTDPNWICGFFKRNPILQLRSWKATSAAREREFNRVSVGKLFYVLRKVADAHFFTAH